MVYSLLYIALSVVPTFSIPLTTTTTRSNSITWDKCDASLTLPSNLQCGTLAVPVNWDTPDGDTFNLAMVRLPRQTNNTKTERIGHLFINSGGPGGSAIELVAQVAGGRSKLSSDIFNSFDIIGVDPRGIGLSAPVDCDPDIWNERVSLFPKTREEYDALVDKSKRLGESCLKRTGDIINYLDTISAAKDHEAVRAALGEKMNWLGLSYGSQLGAQYAQLFPDNIRVMVFDGVLQHSQAEASNILIESTTYAATLQSFFEWAGADEGSFLKGQDVEELWYSILKNAADKPISAPGCDTQCRKDVTEDEFRLNAQQFLTDSDMTTKIMITAALIKASEGDATAFSSPLDPNDIQTSYPGIAISCQDWSSCTSSFEDLQAKMRIGEMFSPLNKGTSQSYPIQASCIGWPAPLNNPPEKLKIQSESPILLVIALHDPSTSYTWAVGMLEEIKHRVLLTRKGDGHTSSDLGGRTAQAITDFLITAELPSPGLVLDS